MSTTLTHTRRISAGRPRGGLRTRTRPDRTDRTGVRAPRPRPVAAARPSQSTRAPRAPFMLLVVGLLGGGLVSLLLLNTVLAEDAFALHALRKRTATLEQREQALRQDVARAEAPHALADKARALGMVPARGSAFVDVGRGKIVGSAQAVPTPRPAARTTDHERGTARRPARDDPSARSTDGNR